MDSCAKYMMPLDTYLLISPVYSKFGSSINTEKTIAAHPPFS